MKIGIIGAGSIGLLYGGYLAEQFDVTMYTRTKEQAEEISKCGVRVRINGDRAFTSSIKADFRFKDLEQKDLIIVAVKNYHLEGLMEMFHSLPIHIPVIFLQNGMGHLCMIDRLQQRNVIVGTVEHGARRNSSFEVSHNGIGKTNLAVYKGNMQSLEELLSKNIIHFPFMIHPDYHQILEKKLLVNALINPLTALLKITNGELIENKHYSAVFYDLFNETAEVFPNINRKEALEEILLICRRTKLNKSSMLTDVENGTKTEIDSILGYILNRSTELNLDLPITRSVYLLVKGMENEGR